jgi:hypothetical protein
LIGPRARGKILEKGKWKLPRRKLVVIFQGRRGLVSVFRIECFRRLKACKKLMGGI